MVIRDLLVDSCRLASGQVVEYTKEKRLTGGDLLQSQETRKDIPLDSPYRKEMSVELFYKDRTVAKWNYSSQSWECARPPEEPLW
jgi:hypothetical protein